MFNLLKKTLSDSVKNSLACKKTRVHIFCNREYRNILKHNKQLKDSHYGKRCFIVGNGPSINKQDLSLLENEFVFAVNYMVMTDKYSIIKPDCYVMSDPLLFSSTEGERIVNKIIEKSTHTPHLVIPLSTGYDWYKKTGGCGLPISQFTFAPTGGVFYDDITLKCNFAEIVSPTYTVVQMATLFALYLGFKDIYIIGADCTGISESLTLWEGAVNDDAHFYKLSKDDSKKQLNRYSNLSSEELCDDIVLHFKGWANIMRGYQRLEQLANKMNATITNATAGGILNYIPRAHYDDLFNNK